MSPSYGCGPASCASSFASGRAPSGRSPSASASPLRGSQSRYRSSHWRDRSSRRYRPAPSRRAGDLSAGMLAGLQRDADGAAAPVDRRRFAARRFPKDREAGSAAEADRPGAAASAAAAISRRQRRTRMTILQPSPCRVTNHANVNGMSRSPGSGRRLLCSWPEASDGMVREALNLRTEGKVKIGRHARCGRRFDV